MIVFAREPVFTPTGRVFAYQINISKDYQDSLLQRHEDITSTDRAVHIKWSDLLDGFVSILNVSNDILMQELPADIIPEDTLFEISNTTSPPGFFDRLITLKSKGYRFVASQTAELNEEFLQLVDFAKLKLNSADEAQFQNLKSQLEKYRVKTIAVDIDNLDQYEMATKKAYDYYQGLFFLDTKTKSSDELPSNKLAVLRLLAEINSDELNVRKLEKVFEQDATLSYLLFRYINNPLVNKYQEITSIRHALSYLGEVMIKKFIAIVSLTQMNADNTPELLQVSLVRAKFCELISMKMRPNIDPTIAFLMGLFSLIDVILARQMSFLMEKVALPQEIKQTLLKREGSLYLMLRASRGFESAHWDTILIAMKEMEITKDEIHGYYVQAIRWANECSVPASSDYPVKSVDR